MMNNNDLWVEHLKYSVRHLSIQYMIDLFIVDYFQIACELLLTLKHVLRVAQKSEKKIFKQVFSEPQPR